MPQNLPQGVRTGAPLYDVAYVASVHIARATMRAPLTAVIDDFAAVHYVEGEILRVVATRPEITAYKVASDGKGAAVTQLRADLV